MKSFLETLLTQRDRWILWTPVAMAIGVGGYFSLHAEPPLWAGLAALGVLVAVLIPFHRNKAAVLVWLPFFLIALGFTAAQWRTWSMDAPSLERKTYPLALEGRVAAVDDLPQGYRFVLDRIRYDTEKRLPQHSMPNKVRITSKSSDAPPVVGDMVSVKAVLLPLSPPVLPGAYDFQRKAFFEGLGATGYAVSKITTAFHPPDSGFFFAAIRRYIRAHIEAAIDDKDDAAVTAGILIGESKGISTGAWENIRLSGLAHLLTIAGLHTGAVTGWFFFLTRFLLASIPYVALRYPVKKIAAALSIAAAIFYLALVNFFLPAERAVIMVCVVMLAIIFDRDPFSLRLLAFAAVLILLFKPESLVGASFGMSFAAVSVLIAFYESTRDWWSSLHHDKRWFMKLALFVLGSMATTGAATLGTAAYSLYFFSRVPLVSGFVANLIAVPTAIAITLPVGAIACLLMPLGLDYWPLKITGWSVEIILKAAEITSHWPYAAYHAGGWPMSLLILISFGGAWLCIWQGRIRWLGALPVLLGVVLIPLTPRADVLISESGKLFAVRDANDILRISSSKAEKFTSQAWIEREGERGYAFWDEQDPSLSCDDEACLYRHKGKLVSFVKEYTALEKDCASADIVISNLYIRHELCAKPAFLLDRKEVKHEGAHALYFGDDGTVTVRTVGDERGERPWSPRWSKFPRQENF